MKLFALDVHDVVACQNAFRVRARHIDPRRLFIEPLLPTPGGDAIVVASPVPACKRWPCLRTVFTRTPNDATFTAGAFRGSNGR